MVKFLLVVSIFLIGQICLLFVPSGLLASRSMSISTDKNSIFGEEEILITASVSGFATDEAIFIKGAFFQEGSTNYFGLTKSGDVWVKNSAGTLDQLKIKIGEWNNTLNIKSDFTDSGFKGNGDYKFKLGFYYTTAGGNLSAINWSENNLTISLTGPSPSPSQSPLPQVLVDPTSIPVSTPLISPSPKLTKISTPTPQPVNTIASPPIQNVLGSEDYKISEPAPVNPPEEPDPVKSTQMEIASLICISIGIILIGLSIYLAIKTSRSALGSK